MNNLIKQIIENNTFLVIFIDIRVFRKHFNPDNYDIYDIGYGAFFSENFYMQFEKTTNLSPFD